MSQSRARASRTMNMPVTADEETGNCSSGVRDEGGRRDCDNLKPPCIVGRTSTVPCPMFNHNPLLFWIATLRFSCFVRRVRSFWDVALRMMGRHVWEQYVDGSAHRNTPSHAPTNRIGSKSSTVACFRTSNKPSQSPKAPHTFHYHVGRPFLHLQDRQPGQGSLPLFPFHRRKGKIVPETIPRTTSYGWGLPI